MTEDIYTGMARARKDGQKRFAVLIDPDQIRLGNIDRVLNLAENSLVDYFFIGGSLVVNDRLDEILEQIKKHTSIPMILFPGNSMQISYRANAILFLSLISGRNAELLIGKHVLAAPFLKLSPLEIMSTGYMLIDGGVPTTVSYISNTRPIPSDKDDIAVCTALAGEMLGMKLIYMDSGSGAQKPISESMIESVSGAISLPLIIGGGIKTPKKALANAKAGADIIVIGNAIEEEPDLIEDMANAIHSLNHKPSVVQ